MYIYQPPAEPKRPSKPAKGKEPVEVEEPNVLPVKPFVTSYRGAMMIVTCICILAVDFKVFPRRFAKTESLGTSLMDLGVGSFVFSAGVISVRQQLKEENGARGVKQSTFISRMITAVRHSLPLLAMGFIRLYTVKGLDYAEHVTEYGVHWNFFFTLGLLPPFVAIFQSVFKLVPSYAIIGYAVSLVHQLFFIYSDLIKWVVLAPREDFLTKNKEGIVSFAGYLAIFLCGQGIGMNILQRDQDPLGPESQEDVWVASMLGGEEALEKAREKRRRYAILTLGKWSAIWCVVYYFTTGYYGPRLVVSRRFGNMAYVVWVCAFNCVQLLLFCGVESLLHPHLYTSNNKAVEKERISKATSKVLHAFNRNGLVIFLLANLLTGLVNLTLPTLHMNDFQAMGVLIIYMGTLTAVALAMDHYNISVKL